MPLRTQSEQTHIDLGALDQRVAGLEDSVRGISEAIKDIGRRIENKPTDTWKTVGGVVAVLGLVGAFLLQGKAPIDDSLNRHDREITRLAETAVSKEDFKAAVAELNGWLSNIRDRLRTDEDNAVSQRQLVELKERLDERYRITTEFSIANAMRTERRVDAIDADLIKRPEITQALTAVGERINAVIASMNELRHDFGADFTLGDAVKSIQDRMNATPPPAK